MTEEETPGPGAPRRDRRLDPPMLDPPVLDRWDVAELRAYIRDLQTEIARTEAAIARRESHRGAADAMFRKP